MKAYRQQVKFFLCRDYPLFLDEADRLLSACADSIEMGCILRSDPRVLATQLYLHR